MNLRTAFFLFFPYTIWAADSPYSAVVSLGRLEGLGSTVYVTDVADKSWRSVLAANFV